MGNVNVAGVSMDSRRSFTNVAIRDQPVGTLALNRAIVMLGGRPRSTIRRDTECTKIKNSNQICQEVENHLLVSEEETRGPGSWNERGVVFFKKFGLRTRSTIIRDTECTKIKNSNQI